MKVTRMKTVKQYLTELDKDKLVETYFGKRSKSLADYYYDAKRNKCPNGDEDLRAAMRFFFDFFDWIIREIAGANFATTIGFRV